MQDLKVIERQVYRLAGHEFNIGSPKQLGVVLFEELKLARGKRTKTGYSTSVDVLNDLASKNEVVREVLKHRELTKLCNTYLEPLRLAARENTHRVHATFNQTGTATGRLSSSDPNLQNIPIRTELGKRIRSAFCRRARKWCWSPRLFHRLRCGCWPTCSGDAQLAEAFKRGEDIHASTAAAILRKDIADVKPEDRRLAKVVNYGLVYGMGDYGLSLRPRYGLSRRGRSLKSTWQGSRVWRGGGSGLSRRRNRAGSCGRFPAGFGRRLVSLTRTGPRPRRPSGTPSNAPVQGSAADIIKSAMLRLDERLSDGEVPESA